MAGAPKGNRNAANAHRARKALEKALQKASGEEIRVGESFKALIEIWEKQIEKAREGDNQSASMIMDRLDGKPGQAVTVAGDEEKPVIIKAIELIPLEATSTDTE